MKKLRFVAVSLILFSFIGSGIAISDDKKCELEGYPYYFTSISQAGYFKMVSPECEDTHFRDIRTGRLINTINDEEYSVEPMIMGDYIFLRHRKDNQFTGLMTLIDRDGAKKEFDTKNGNQLFFFDDEVIQIHQEYYSGGVRFWREVNGETIWEFDIPDDDDLGMTWTTGIQEREVIQTNDRHRDYLWICDGLKLETKVYDIRDGTVAFQIDNTSKFYLRTNGLLSVAVLYGFEEKDPCVTVFNMDTGKILWECEKEEYFRCFVYEDKATIIMGDKPEKSWEEIKHKVYVIDKNNGLEAEYEFTVPQPINPRNKYLLKAKEHIICCSIPVYPGFVIIDARIDDIFWKPEDNYFMVHPRFYGDTLLLSNSSKILEALDLNTHEILWKYECFTGGKTVEYDGLEYIINKDIIKVRDTKFDVIEPYEYDISEIRDSVEYIPTKHGLLIVPNIWGNNSLARIMLMRAGIKEPVYVEYQGSMWVKSWERLEDDDFLKLVIINNMDLTNEKVLYLHIPTGFMQLTKPE